MQFKTNAIVQLNMRAILSERIIFFTNMNKRQLRELKEEILNNEHTDFRVIAHHSGVLNHHHIIPLKDTMRINYLSNNWIPYHFLQQKPIDKENVNE